MDDLERLDELFIAAVELSADEQARFLDSACHDDPVLRAELNAMLRADRIDQQEISSVVEAEAALLLDSPISPGDRLGAYRIVSEIGHGGMGAVYLAVRDDAHFEKRVAIKVIKRGMDSVAVVNRFRHERQILANLDHPYIAHLVDGGATREGQPFFVMDYVNGQPIDVFCRERKLDVKDRCRLLRRVAEAVSHAHRNLVVHRDLKPANILVTADGTPRLLDFGVAKLLTSEANELTTASGWERPFTPQYASPEQIRGEAITTATDVYSLGAVFYELLAGRPAQPVEGHTAFERDRIICENEPAPPSRYAAGVETDLDNIVLKALDKESERRYHSVEQFSEDLDRYLIGWPVLARPNSLLYRSGKFILRHRFVFAIATLMILSLVAGTIVAVSQKRQAEAARLVAELEAQRSRDRLTQIVNLSNRSLADIHEMDRRAGTSLSRQMFIRNTLEFLENLSRDAHNDASLRKALATAYLRLGALQGDLQAGDLTDVHAALASYEKGRDLIEPLRRGAADPESTLLWLELQQKTGVLLIQSGNLPQADRLLRATLADAEQFTRSESGSIRAVLAETGIRSFLAGELEAASDLPQALRHTTQARDQLNEAVKRFPGDPPLLDNLAAAETRLGWELVCLDDPESAEPHYLRALELRERLAREHPDDVLYRRSRMLAYEHMGTLLDGPLQANLDQPQAARKYYARAQALEEAALADTSNHPSQLDYAHFLLLSSIIDLPREDYSRSLLNLQKAEQYYQTFAKAAPDIFQNWHELAITQSFSGERLAKLGRQEEALAKYRQAFDTAVFELSKHPETWFGLYDALEAQRGITLTLALRNEREGALESARKLVARADQGLRFPTEPELRKRYSAEARITLASVFRTFGDCGQARAEALTAIASLQPLINGRKSDPAAKSLRQARAIAAECQNY